MDAGSLWAHVGQLRRRLSLSRDPQIAAFIDREFAAFREIRRADLDELAQVCRPEDRIAFIQIKDQMATCLNAHALQRPPHTLPTFLALFTQIGTRFPLPDVRFALNLLDEARVLVVPGRGLRSVPLGDGYRELLAAHGGRPDAARHPAIFSPMPHALFHHQVPIFSVSKIPGLHQDILLPTLNAFHYALNPSRDARAWTARAPRLYWRGSTTGGVLTHDTWRRFPRVQLVAAARATRHCDMGISAVIQAEGDSQDALRAAMAAEGLCAAYDPFGRNFEHRYLYDIEGNSFSSRLPQFLASGSVVCKPDPIWVEHYYHGLRPWEHYIPMDPGFADLDDAVERAESRPDATRAIAGRASAFCDRYLSFDALAAVTASLLWRYRALQVR